MWKKYLFPVTQLYFWPPFGGGTWPSSVRASRPRPHPYTALRRWGLSNPGTRAGLCSSVAHLSTLHPQNRLLRLLWYKPPQVATPARKCPWCIYHYIHLAICRFFKAEPTEELAKQSRRTQALEDEGWVTSGYTGTRSRWEGRWEFDASWISWVVKKVHAGCCRRAGREDGFTEEVTTWLIPHGQRRGAHRAQARVKAGLISWALPDHWGEEAVPGNTLGPENEPQDEPGSCRLSTPQSWLQWPLGRRPWMMPSLDISRPESKFKVFPSNFETGDPGVSSCAFSLCSLTAGVTTQPGFTMGSLTS